jgi:hypothetical protein
MTLPFLPFEPHARSSLETARVCLRDLIAHEDCALVVRLITQLRGMLAGRPTTLTDDDVERMISESRKQRNVEALTCRGTAPQLDACMHASLPLIQPLSRSNYARQSSAT